jgi:SagB-type dehydrogenase family enzyme
VFPPAEHAIPLSGVNAGLYHYDVERHALELISDGNFEDQLRRATCDLFEKFDRPPCALFVFASRVSRAMWRYRDDRSARAPLVDLGHVLMAYRTAAKALGLSYYTFQKFHDADILKLFGINKFEQPPLFVGTLV